MNAGQELDALIAEKIFGCNNVRDRGSLYQTCDCPSYESHGASMDIGGATINSIPSYSTRIAAAWQVLEKLRTDEAEVKLIGMSPAIRTMGYGSFICTIYRDIMTKFEGRGQTAPEAICKAALKTVGIE